LNKSEPQIYHFSVEDATQKQLHSEFSTPTNNLSTFHQQTPKGVFCKVLLMDYITATKTGNSEQ